eukprot:355779-Chlamydomonas_euryale.AAC.3
MKNTATHPHPTPQPPRTPHTQNTATHPFAPAWPAVARPAERRSLPAALAQLLPAAFFVPNALAVRGRRCPPPACPCCRRRRHRYRHRCRPHRPDHGYGQWRRARPTWHGASQCRQRDRPRQDRRWRQRATSRSQHGHSATPARASAAGRRAASAAPAAGARSLPPRCRRRRRYGDQTCSYPPAAATPMGTGPATLPPRRSLRRWLTRQAKAPRRGSPQPVRLRCRRCRWRCCRWPPAGAPSAQARSYPGAPPPRSRPEAVDSSQAAATCRRRCRCR